MTINLLDFKYDKYSSTGNDGIIEKIFKILNISEGFFVEFGAWDGIRGSNCRKLYKEGWSGVFIEFIEKRYEDLMNNYKEDEDIICIKSMVGINDNLFDDIIEPYMSNEIDFCSIDIDGLDVEVFKTFKLFLPKVICIEGGQMLPPYHSIISNKKAKHNIQQSLSVMVDIFTEKGYVPICSYQDTFFVREEYYKQFDVPRDLMDLYLDGLIAHVRRIPWIRKKIKSVNLKNPILNEIVEKADFKSYGYRNRKKWAVEKIDRITTVIEQIRERYHNG